jgi:hypothetical protein
VRRLVLTCCNDDYADEMRVCVRENMNRMIDCKSRCLLLDACVSFPELQVSKADDNVTSVSATITVATYPLPSMLLC